MHISSRMVTAFCLLGLCSSVMALDKDHFTKLRPETVEQVINSFQSPLYYILSDKGDSSVTAFGQKPAYASLDFKFGLLLFINPADAAEWAKGAEEEMKVHYQVKVTTINQMMMVQYRTLDKPISTRPEAPDVIIVETLAKRMPVVETFRRKDTMEPFVYTKGTKRFIPAFFSREDAIAFEQTVKADAKGEYVRVGLDMRSHLAFVESCLATDAPVVTFGYGAAKLMEAYTAR